MKRKDLQQLSALRLREAKLLLQANCPDGAYYLAGYAAECAIKACIAKATERHEFPDKKRAESSYTHNAVDLIRVAGLNKALHSAITGDSNFAEAWEVVRQWSEAERYERHSIEEAETLIVALSDRKHGILRWLKQFW